jgi:hypothetical protein
MYNVKDMVAVDTLFLFLTLQIDFTIMILATDFLEISFNKLKNFLLFLCIESHFLSSSIDTGFFQVPFLPLLRRLFFSFILLCGDL